MVLWFGLVWFGGFFFNASLGPQRRARKRGRLAEAARFGLVWFGLVGFSFIASLGPQRPLCVLRWDYFSLRANDAPSFIPAPVLGDLSGHRCKKVTMKQKEDRTGCMRREEHWSMVEHWGLVHPQASRMMS
jgi:hypothetical protein